MRLHRSSCEVATNRPLKGDGNKPVFAAAMDTVSEGRICLSCAEQFRSLGRPQAAGVNMNCGPERSYIAQHGLGDRFNDFVATERFPDLLAEPLPEHMRRGEAFAGSLPSASHHSRYASG